MEIVPVVSFPTWWSRFSKSYFSTSTDLISRTKSRLTNSFESEKLTELLKLFCCMFDQTYLYFFDRTYFYAA